MAGVLAVFNLCLCKSGITVGAPVNGLKSLVDIALRRHFCKNLNLLLLKLFLKRDIRVVPLADNTHSLKALTLNINIRKSGVAADFTKL